jgi:hypothetical protein
MTDTNEPTYTEAQYNSLTPEEQKILHEVATHLTGEPITTDDETLQNTFNILRPCEGCLPDEEIGDDLLADIRRKFACVYYSAIERAENELKTRGLHFHDDFSFCLVIDPCYESSTHVAVVDFRPDVRPFCYFHDYANAWHFSFPSLKDIAYEVTRAEKMILRTFLRLRKQHSNERNKQ